MIPSAKQGKSNNPPPSPSKDYLEALSKLTEDKFAKTDSLKAPTPMAAKVS